MHANVSWICDISYFRMLKSLMLIRFCILSYVHLLCLLCIVHLQLIPKTNLENSLLSY